MALKKRIILSFIITLGLIISPFSFLGTLDNSNTQESRLLKSVQAQKDVSTTVHITVCGNGIVETGEFCDDGADNGKYGSSASSRYCNTTCDGWAPYCGDGILHQEHGEECDDGNNVSNDGCDESCKLEAGGGGGGGGLYPGGSYVTTPSTGVVVRGKAYPNAEVYILQEGEVIGITRANSLADFVFSIDDVTPGVTTFGFWAEDVNGIRSIFITITFQIIPKAVTTVSGIMLPPTIVTDKTSVSKGENIKIFGQTIPDSNVYIYVSSPSEIVKEVKSQSDGVWNLSFDTTPLQEDSFHTAKAFFQTTSLGTSIKSGFSKFISFYVGEEAPEGVLCPEADLNGDGRVNLMDFSILLYYWGTDNVCADQNQDGIVNLADFSIMMYYWTG